VPASNLRKPFEIKNVKISWTNSQSRRSVDCAIGNLQFDLSVDFVPKVIITENCRLDNKICTGYDFFEQ